MKHRCLGPLTLTFPRFPRLEILPVAFSKVFSKTSSMASSFYPWLFEWNINKPWGLDNERWIVEKKYEGTEEGSSVLEPKKDHPQRFHPTWTAELAMEALVPFSLVIALQWHLWRTASWYPSKLLIDLGSCQNLDTIPASVDETFNHFYTFPLGPALPIATLQWNIIYLKKIKTSWDSCVYRVWS